MNSDYNYSNENPPMELIICIPKEKKYIINDKQFNSINNLISYIKSRDVS
jgi:hypothetical protein